MTERSEYLGCMVDGIMDYWRSGMVDDEWNRAALAKWWETQECADAALEIAHAVKQALEEHGFEIRSAA